MNDDKLSPLENYHPKISFLVQLKEKRRRKEQEDSDSYALAIAFSIRFYYTLNVGMINYNVFELVLAVEKLDCFDIETSSMPTPTERMYSICDCNVGQKSYFLVER